MPSPLDQLKAQPSAQYRVFTGLVRTVDATTEPVTLAQAKAHCRVDFSDDDDLITALITAARVAVENYTQRSLITQTWALTLDGFPAGGSVRLPRGPLQSVTTVNSYDDDDTESTYADTNYLVDTAGNRVALNSGAVWPTDLRPAAGVAITYVTGYGDAATDVPGSLIHAVKLLVAHYYEQREGVLVGAPSTDLPLGVRYLLEPYVERRL